MSETVAIWVLIAILYSLFRCWYDGLKGALTAEEIETLMAMMAKRVEQGLPAQDLDVLRKFMEEDDGKEFLMANLVRFKPSPVSHPITGTDIDARDLLQQYFKPLMAKFLRRAGHPVLTSRVVGGYLDEMDMESNPGWHVVGFVRYRSRRDAMLATMNDPSFDKIYPLKVAALQKTFAIPTQTVMSLYLSPKVSVFLFLIIAGLCTQLLL